MYSLHVFVGAVGPDSSWPPVLAVLAFVVIGLPLAWFAGKRKDRAKKKDRETGPRP